MEYDDRVSARLHMSLDEIIGQEQQDGASHSKKRRARGAATAGGPSPSASVASTPPSAVRPPPSLPSTESAAPRYAVPLPPPMGAPACYPSRALPSARPPLPALMRGPPPARLPGPPPFAGGPRGPPFHLAPGHPRMDSGWLRPRHPSAAAGFLMPPNGIHPPPPPMAAAVPDPRCPPPRGCPPPPRPWEAEAVYSPRRPLVCPYGLPRPVQPGPLRSGWKRSRYADQVAGQNGEHSPQPPLGYAGAVPGLSPAHAMGGPNGSLAGSGPYSYDSRGPQQHPGADSRLPPEYYEQPYLREGPPAGERQGAPPMQDLAPGGLPCVPQPGALSRPLEGPRGLQMPAEQSMGGPEYPRASGRALGPRGDGAAAERREYTVIVSNVPKDLPAVEIQEAFSCMGTVLRTDIMLNSKGEHTGRVCIAFASAEAAKTAVAQFDEGDLNGNTIRVFAE